MRTTQSDATEIVNRASLWAGSMTLAVAWYQREPLPSCGGRTAEDLVNDGRADAVKAYLSRIEGGGYA